VDSFWGRLLDAAPVLGLFFGVLAVCGIAWLVRTRQRPDRYPARHGLGADAYTSRAAGEIADRQIADGWAQDAGWHRLPGRDEDPPPLPLQDPWSRS